MEFRSVIVNVFDCQMPGICIAIRNTSNVKMGCVPIQMGYFSLAFEFYERIEGFKLKICR